MAQYRIGIVLSGGGARGMAHLGVLKALEERGIFPEIVSGTSAGAIAGGFYCGGLRPDEIFKILRDVEYLRSIRPGLGSAGLISNKSVARVLEKHLPFKVFEDLKMPLYVCATQLRTGKSIYFSSGDLIEPIKASAAIPVLVSPVEIAGELYVDGGVLNNYPLDPIEGKCDLILGSTVNPIQTTAIAKSMLAVAERTYMLSIRDNAAPREARTDWLVEPEELHRYGIMEIRKAEEIFRIGYEAAVRKLDESDPLQLLQAKLNQA